MADGQVTRVCRKDTDYLKGRWIQRWIFSPTGRSQNSPTGPDTWVCFLPEPDSSAPSNR